MPPSAPTTGPAAPLGEDAQRQLTALCAQTALLLMQHGTESAVVENMVRRLARALGVERVEVGVFANSIVITTGSPEREVTTVRRGEDRGINMHVVIEIQRAVLALEVGEIDAAAFRARVERVVPFHYPRSLVSLAIALSCASFARLAGADWVGCGVVAVASGAAMAVRLLVARLGFNPLVTFFVAGFVATSIADWGELGNVGETRQIAVASCVLLLVPGFPLINGVSDMVKGYWSTGVARLVHATLLSIASCVGILLAMSLWKM